MIVTDPHDKEAPTLSDTQEAWEAGRDRCIDDLLIIAKRLSSGLYGLFWDSDTEKYVHNLIRDIEAIPIPSDEDLTEGEL